MEYGESISAYLTEYSRCRNFLIQESGDCSMVSGMSQFTENHFNFFSTSSFIFFARNRTSAYLGSLGHQNDQFHFLYNKSDQTWQVVLSLSYLSTVAGVSLVECKEAGMDLKFPLV